MKLVMTSGKRCPLDEAVPSRLTCLRVTYFHGEKIMFSKFPRMEDCSRSEDLELFFSRCHESLKAVIWNKGWGSSREFLELGF